MSSDNNVQMSQKILTNLLSNLRSPDDKTKFLEAMSIIGTDVSRRIIAKAASPHSAVVIDEFPEITETTMMRHLYLLQSIGLLKSVWEDNKRKFAITDLGKSINSILNQSDPN
jgi:hypothetical protein